MHHPLSEQEQLRFTLARNKIIVPGDRERSGIGMQKEKTLHAVLKNYYEPREQFQEVPAEGYIADIFNEEGITEIQTRDMGHMQEKLSVFLPKHRVRIVYPIPHIKYVTWIDPETGELEKRNRSPFTGSWYEAFRPLYRIREHLGHPNLAVDLLLVDMEEYRIRDGWGNGGKRGSHRFDRIPSSIFDVMTLETPADYAALLPDDLPEIFTAKDLSNCVGIRRKSVSFSSVMNIMVLMQAAEITGTGPHRARLYRKIFA